MDDERGVLKPRPGLLGVLDRFVGPGATPAELLLQFSTALVAAGAAVVYSFYAIGTWTLLQYVFCAVLAFDIMGGIITNATSSGKRWYHRIGQGFPQHFGFVTLHLGHVAMVSWLFMEFDVWWFAAAGTYLLIASLIIILSPLYLQRPITLLMYACSLLIAHYVLARPQGLEWFLPFFYLKLLVAYLPKEEKKTGLSPPPPPSFYTLFSSKKNKKNITPG